MKSYEIEYMVKGKKCSMVEYPKQGWESQFLQGVIYRIQSIVDGGGVITKVTERNWN